MTEDIAGFRTKVLIVEDEEFTRTILADSLAASGMTVRSAISVAEALDVLLDFEPNAVVTDLHLGPGPDGVDLLERLNRDLPWIGQVVLTSHTSVQVALGINRRIPERAVYLVKSRITSLADVEVHARFAGLFAAQGIAPERLRLRGPSGLAEMMQDYGEIDIALDPTPYNGGTTTLQALWMGVPVVALTGGNFVSRMGASFMATLGRPDWVAEDDDRYVDAAVKLARDIAGLRAGRPALRARMAGSALCDVNAYVQAFQALLQRMWAQHCAGGGGRLLGVASAPTTSR